MLMTTPQRWGTEIFVGGVVYDDEPEVTALADGRSVVVWVDYNGGIQQVRGQILNADGSLRGGQFAINSNPSGEHLFPNITALSDGRFVAVWTDQSDPKYGDNLGEDAGHKADIFGQVFNIDGSKSGNEFKVNVGTLPAHGLIMPGVTAHQGGGFSVTWRDYINPTPGEGFASVRIARHDGNGNQVVGPKHIADSVDYSNLQPVIQGLDNGNSVIVWSQGTITNEINLLARIVDANGNTVSELGDIGAPFDDTADVVQITPEITKLKDGGFVVTWKVDDETTESHDYGVWARVFYQNGTPRSEAFRISPPEHYLVDPAVTALKDGRFMVTWADFTNSDALASEVKAQVYSAAGVKDGDTFTVNTPHATHDKQPSITTLEDGRVMVSWWHDGASDNANTIRAQIIDPREGPIELSPQTLEAYKIALNNDWVGTGFGDKFDAGGGNDQIEGGAGADVIIGGEGFDTVTFAHAGAGVTVSLSGGTGGDAAGDSYSSIEQLIGSGFADTFFGNGWAVLQGGAGNDTYHVSGRDQVVETTGGGYDTVIFTGSYTLAAGAEVEELRLSGASKSKSYSLTGSNVANTLKGSVGKDTLKGLDGTDKLYGGSGNDKLYGGSGKDMFVFDTKLGSYKTDRKVNFDMIDKGFDYKHDSIWLDNKVFTKLGKKGSESKPAKLNKKFFTIGDKAKDKDDYIVYNKKTGVLSYDKDGSGKSKAVEFAKLYKNEKVAYNDFFVI
jgi:hypothetical protein